MAIKGTSEGLPRNVGMFQVEEGLKYYYTRETSVEPLAGPYSFHQARDICRAASMENDTKSMEMLQYVGQRPGDPKKYVRLEIVHKFFEGRIIISGQYATALYGK